MGKSVILSVHSYFRQDVTLCFNLNQQTLPYIHNFSFTTYQNEMKLSQIPNHVMPLCTFDCIQVEILVDLCFRSREMDSSRGRL